MQLDRDTIESLKEIFVTKDSCDRTVRSEDEKISKLEIKLARLDTKLGVLIALLSAIAVPVISLCIKLLFGG